MYSHRGLDNAEDVLVSVPWRIGRRVLYILFFFFCVLFGRYFPPRGGRRRKKIRCGRQGTLTLISVEIFADKYEKGWPIFVRFVSTSRQR